MRLLSWNVNGLRAVHNKGIFLPFLREHQPDVLALQETKARFDVLPGELQDVPGYRLFDHPARRNGYSGVAIYTRHEPDEVLEGLGDPLFDDEGRVLALRFGELVVLSAYFPNSQPEGVRLGYRLAFGAQMVEYLATLRQRGYRVALGGDFNVAHQPIDLARPKQNEKNPGYLPGERDWMTAFLGAGYIDTWRDRHPERPEVYSWWSYRAGARSRNIGWRLDYWCIGEDLVRDVRDVAIHCGVTGSDHCPVAVTLE